MGLLYLPGEASNHLLSSSLVAADFSDSDTEDPNLPWLNLANPQGWFAGRFNTAGTDDFIHVDLGSAKTADFCSIHFHNLDAGITVELYRDPTGSVLISTLTKDTPAFYSTFSPVGSAQWRLKFVGTNSSPIYIGKWVLGESSSLTLEQKYGWEVEYVMEQQRVAGNLPPKNMTSVAKRDLALSFDFTTTAQRDEVLEMHRDSAWGAEPIVVVPDDNNPLVTYGRLNGIWKYSEQPGGHYPNKIEVVEDPFPVIVN